MGDENPEDQGPQLATSRRKFLQGATGVAVVSFAALATRESRIWAQEPQQGPSDLADACCSNASAIALMAAAFLQGSYVGLAASKSGPSLFALNVGKDGGVTLGSPLKLNLPEGFVFSSLGVARGRLVLSGGVPFLLESYEVDEAMNEDVLAAMDVVPQGLPPSGRRRIEVMGVKPSVLLLDLPSSSVEPLDLPAMPTRAFAVATGVAETASGMLTALIEHSDGMNESYYASAIDVVEESLNGEWTHRSVARQLGESGPNFLAVNADEIVVGLNSSQGARLVSPKLSALSAAAGVSVEGRILALVPGNSGFTVLTGKGSEVKQLSVASPGASFVDSGTVGLRADQVVGAVPVAGAWGQSIVLGRRSARLVDETSGSTVRI